MRPEPKSRPALSSHAEARAIADRARRLRAEVLGQMARAVWSRVTRRAAAGQAGAPAGASQGALPHARA